MIKQFTIDLTNTNDVSLLSEMLQKGIVIPTAFVYNEASKDKLKNLIRNRNIRFLDILYVEGFKVEQKAKSETRSVILNF